MTVTRIALRGGIVVDGTGAPGRRADVIVNGSRVEAVVEPGQGDGETIDATDRIVAPGFIDLHTHCDFTLPSYPRAPAMVRQGVTTIVTGNCGFSTFPVPAGERLDLLRSYTAFLGKDLDWSWRTYDDYVELLESRPLALNVAPLIGHGTVRVHAMGYDNRAATVVELDTMRSSVEAAMASGAFGLSSGLIYPPGTYAPSDELVELATLAARAGGFYATHMRNEGPQLLEAVAEAIDIATRSGAPLQLSHHKVLGRPHWGTTERSLQLIEETRAGGLDVLCDQYPYDASSTNLAALLPGWVQEGGSPAMQARLRDPEQRAAIRHEVLHGPPGGRKVREFEPDLVTIASVGGSADNPLAGRSIADLAREEGVQDVDRFLDLLTEHGGALECVAHSIGEEDLLRVMRDPFVAVASDGWTLDPSQGGLPHPRSYGTFARVLGHFVRERRVLDLPEAVRKMTSLPAGRLGLTDRGRVVEGSCADLVVFDADHVVDRATYLDPHQLCAGVDHVLVGGTPVVLDGDDTGAAAGTVLRSSP